MKSVKMTLKILIFSLFGILFLASSCADQKRTKEGNTQSKSTNSEVNSDIATNETYTHLDDSIVEKLNQNIKDNNLNSEEKIMRFFRPQTVVSEGHYTYVIGENKINNTTKEITLIEDGLLDDSVKAIKLVMQIQKIEGVLHLKSIKESYKCRKNRGHENWSAELCH